MSKILTVIKSEKKFKELSGSLSGKGQHAIIETIKALRDDEPFEGAIGLLSELYDATEDRAIKKTIEEFLNDIKDQGARPEIITEVRRPWKQDTLGMLVASCWQSGLDYSDYLTELVHTFLEGSYTTAIECMTVIDEAADKCETVKKKEIIRMIEESPLSGLNEKSALTLELISILER